MATNKSIVSAIKVLDRLAVAPGRQAEHGNPVDDQCDDIVINIAESRSLQQDCTHQFHEIGDRIDDVDILGPVRHGFDRGEEPAHHHKNDHKEEADENCLLQRARQRGDQQAQPEDGHQVDGSRDKQYEKTAVDRNVEKDFADSQAETEFHQSDDQERDEFADDELVLADGRHVDLLDRTEFLFTHDVQAGQKSADDRYQNRENCRHHENFVVQFRIVPERRPDLDALLRDNAFGYLIPLGDNLPVVAARDGRGITIADPGHGSVDGVEKELHFGAVFPHEVFFEIGRNVQDDVGLAVFHGFPGFIQ